MQKLPDGKIKIIAGGYVVVPLDDIEEELA